MTEQIITDPTATEHVGDVSALQAVQAPEQVKPEAQQVVESLTGFDEIAVKLSFGDELENLGALTLSRALVFTLLRRQGSTDREAHKSAMEMPQRQVKSYFADTAEDERDPFGGASGNA